MQIAAAYIRVSTDDQTEFSPAAQLKGIRAWAASNGYIVPDEYVFSDEGISGRSAEKRPAFMRMIATAKQQPSPFTAILVHKFDRFARSREDSVFYKAMLRKTCGVQVISISESIADDRFSIIIESMLEGYAEFYSVNLSSEVRKGMTERAQRGKRNTCAPFGYRNHNGSLIPQPEEAAAVRELYTRWAAGESLFSLARWLNASGLRTRRGGAFSNRSVRYILTNMTYIGKNCWNANGSQSKSTGYVVQPDTIIADGDFEPLIDMDLWNAVQRRLKFFTEKFGHDHRPTAHVDWISGLVRCPVCGNVMVRNVQGTYADGSPAIYWLCNGYAHGRCVFTNTMRDDVFKEAFINGLVNAGHDMAAIASHALLLSKAKSNPYPAMREKLHQQLKRAGEAYRAGVDSLADYAEAKRQIQSQLDKLAEEEAVAHFEDPDVSDAPARVAAAVDALSALLRSNAPMQQKHDAVHSLVDSAVIDKRTRDCFVFFSPSFIASDS